MEEFLHAIFKDWFGSRDEELVKLVLDFIFLFFLVRVL